MNLIFGHPYENAKIGIQTSVIHYLLSLFKTSQKDKDVHVTFRTFLISLITDKSRIVRVKLLEKRRMTSSFCSVMVVEKVIQYR